MEQAQIIYKPGDVITPKCLPFVHSLKRQYWPSRCYYCFKKDIALETCTGCHRLYYCNEECAQKDWDEGHENECPFMADGKLEDSQLVNGEEFEPLVIFLRLYFKLKSNPEVEDQEFPLFDGTSVKFQQLLSHKEMVKIDRMQHIALLRETLLKKFGLEIDEDTTAMILGKHWTNSFAIQDDMRGETIGSGLYLQAAKFNHSCYPNAAWVFHQNKLEVRAVRPIFEGEEVLVSYINLFAQRDTVRNKLATQFYFNCRCELCQIPRDQDPRTLYAGELERLKTEVKNLTTKEEILETWADILTLTIRVAGLANKHLPLQMYHVLSLMTEEARNTKDSDFYERLDRRTYHFWKEFIHRSALHFALTFGKDSLMYRTFMSWVSLNLRWPRDDLLHLVTLEVGPDNYPSLLAPVIIPPDVVEPKNSSLKNNASSPPESTEAAPVDASSPSNSIGSSSLATSSIKEEA